MYCFMSGVSTIFFPTIVVCFIACNTKIAILRGLLCGCFEKDFVSVCLSNVCCEIVKW